MNATSRELMLWALAGVGLYLIVRKVTVREAAAGATRAAGDVATGVVYGAGDVLGVPRTDAEKCAAAMREGRTWDASFACPAGTFLRYLF